MANAVYDPPPSPHDRKLKQAIFALEVLASNESQPDELRRDARLLQYWLCYEHLDDDDKDWTWVVEHLAPSDKHVTYVLKTAMDVTPEPDEDNINVLLWFRLVKLEINDCWNDHHADGAGSTGSIGESFAAQQAAGGTGGIAAAKMAGVGQLVGGTGIGKLAGGIGAVQCNAVGMPL